MKSNYITPNDSIANTNFFSKRNLHLLKERMTDQHLNTGSHLFWEGETADKLYFVYSGSIKITKTTDEGKELILHMYQHGDVLGLLNPFHASIHHYNAIAVEPCHVGMMNQQDMELLLLEKNDLAIDFMKLMSINQRIMETKMRDLMMFGKSGALCSTLIRMSNSFGHKEGNTIVITRKITHTELSQMIGATRESVNRMLNDLRKQEIIDYDQDSIIIKDLEQLKAICRCENCPEEICRI